MRMLFILIGLFAFNYIIIAQNKPQPNMDSFQNKKFNLDSSLFEVPQYHNNEGFKNKPITPAKKWNEVYLKNPSVDIEDIKPSLNISNEYKMPIYKPQFHAEMPTSKPDSMVRYHIRIKDLNR